MNNPLRKGFYFTQSLLFITLGVIFSIYTLLSFDGRLIDNLSVTIIFAIGMYIISHILRILRLYILFIEKKLPVRKIVPVYLGTSWISFIIPFKFGEVHRIFEFSRLCNSMKMSFVSLWIERFFDSMVLTTIILLLNLNSPNNISSMLIIILVFLILSLFLFLTFPKSYRYTNHILISESKSSKGLRLLEILNSLKDYYEYAKRLIQGRFSILFAVTLLIWLVEIAVLYLALGSMTSKVSILDLNNILSNLWLVSKNSLYPSHQHIVYLVLVVGAIVLFISKLANKLKSLNDPFKKGSSYIYSENSK